MTLLWVSGAIAQVTAPWSQFQGGPGHPGVLEDGPEPPYRIRWTFPAPDGTSLTGAVIVDDVAIAVGRGAVYGVEVASGRISWEVSRDGGPLSLPALDEVGGAPILLYLEGPPSEGDAGASPSPTPQEGADREGEAASDLVALGLEDRSERWRLPLGATSRSGVTIQAGVAYVGDQAGIVHAVAIEDGVERWTAEVGGRADLPIAVADGLVYVISRHADERNVQITALTASDGERAWRVAPQVGSTTISGPAALEGGVVVGTADRLVRMLDAADGEERWASLGLSLFSPASAPAAAGGQILLADVGGGLYRLDAGAGDRRWGYQFNDLVLRSSPVRSGDVVLLGLNDGRLVAVGMETGRLLWESEAAPGLIGTIALSPDAVIAVKGGREAGLIAFEHDPEGALLDLPSPTEFDAGAALARAALAALAVSVVAFVPAALARRRFGDAFEADEDRDDGVEPGGDG